REFLELNPVTDVKGMALGKFKRHPDDTDKYAIYVAHHMRPGDNNNLLCIGAPGSGKSRGFIIPFLIGCAQRGESVFVTDPKGELFEKLSPYFAEHGHYVKAVNFLDMEHSDGWNCLYGLDTETQLVQTVANTIIANTSGPKEADDFWSRAELNLLMALIHYVCRLTDERGNLLPIEQRGIGNIYQILAHESIDEINRKLAELPPDHPAKGPHGLFLIAKENLWGNIVIGLGNRLAVYQSQLVDKITRNHDVDLVLPGKRPCAYFVIISAQDSSYRFLSSLFFSLAIPQLSDFARLHGDCGRLPVLVNFCLDEYCNIGYMDGMADALNSIRGFNMSCQIVVQSLSQWEEKYPGKEWENQLGTFNTNLYMGCNDIASADYIAKKCGKVTISVTNNQMPLMPLFSPIYSSTRPYSQTRSNTARDLMLSDEVLRLDNRKCLVLFQGHKPAMLYKLTPEEIPGYKDLKSCRVIDYIPEWKRREMGETEKSAGQTAHREQSTKAGLEPQGGGTITGAAPQTLNRQSAAGTKETQSWQGQQTRKQSRQSVIQRTGSQRTGGTWSNPQTAARPDHASRQEYVPTPMQSAADWNKRNCPQESQRESPPELEYDFSSLSAGPGIPDISDWEEIRDNQTGEAQSPQQFPRQENSQSIDEPPEDNSLGMVECSPDSVLGL
ncbi:MAG: type IV secretory system conjugative DNA transfer family protein, partial [Oscillibacter sp.]|nr:type IV secretory system conjugative DNA transfer family protein [Oscillibacter sp.]